MQQQNVVYAWENLPEYRATQQLGRVVGRILMSLPRRERRTIGKTLVRLPVLIGQGIVGANAELPPDQEIGVEQRDMYRHSAVAGVHLLRDLFRVLRVERIGSVPDLLAGIELLDRIGEGIAARS